MAGHPITVICAGRTDSGVHAVGQVIHFETAVKRTSRAWVLGANTKLPPTVALQWVGDVSGGFHARHSATLRHYHYCILNCSARSALQRLRSAWIHRLLNADAMHLAGQVLVGEHNYSAFRSVECQSKTAVRRVERLLVKREGDVLWLEIVATAYLHHMVRNIVGTLVKVQSMADPVGAMATILAEGSRHLAGVTAPAAGLFLWRVEYPPMYGIPTREPGLMLPPMS